jgi:hypothetical protein
MKLGEKYAEARDVAKATNGATFSEAAFLQVWTATQLREAMESSPSIVDAVKVEQARLREEQDEPPRLQYADAADISDEEKTRRDRAFQIQA